jgi:outer membrane protease
MKTILSFVFFVSMLSIGVFPVSIYGQDNLNFTIGKAPYRISLAGETGVLLGHAEEIVYKSSNTDTYLSQLLWDLKPLVYLGSNLSLSRVLLLDGLGAVADLSIKFGIPMASGTMEDRDWLKETDILTNFSSHDAYIQSALLLDIAGGISIPIVQTVAIKALVSFSYMRFSWNAKDGTGRYMKQNKDGDYLENEWYRLTWQGTVISYEQAWVIISPGLGLSWPFFRTLGLDFRFFTSPLVFVNGLDIHIERKLQFSDTLRWGLYLEPVLDFSFNPTRYISLILHGSWRYITGTRGDTVTTSTVSNSAVLEKSADQAGVGYSAFDVGLFVKFVLPLGGAS